MRWPRRCSASCCASTAWVSRCSRLDARRGGGGVSRPLWRRLAGGLVQRCHLLPGRASPHRRRSPRGIPVIAGGPAFGIGPRRAGRLGADAWALTVADAVAILLDWKAEPPSVSRGPTPVDPVALRLTAQADALGVRARRPHRPLSADGRLRRAPDRPHPGGSCVHRPIPGRNAARRRPPIFADFLDWLRNLLVQRDVPPQA